MFHAHSANRRCEYCHLPDALTPYGHQVDHIIPIKHGGLTRLESLAYACLLCNTFKGTDVAIYDLETGAITPLYNPRTQIWEDHFEINNLLILPKTPIARVTIRLLRLNDPKQIEARRALSDIGLWPS